MPSVWWSSQSIRGGHPFSRLGPADSKQLSLFLEGLQSASYQDFYLLGLRQIYELARRSTTKGCKSSSFREGIIPPFRESNFWTLISCFFVNSQISSNQSRFR